MIADYVKTLRLVSRDVRLYLVCAGLVAFGYLGIWGVVLNLYLLRLGYGPRFIGLLSAAGSLTWAVAALPVSWFGRRWGSRRAMIVGLALEVVCLTLMPLSETAPERWQEVWLLATRVLARLGHAFLVVNGISYLMGATGDEERNHAFGIRKALTPLTGVVGGLVGGFLPPLVAATMGVSPDDAAPFRVALLVSALIPVPGLAALLAARDVDNGEGYGSGSSAGPIPWGLIGLLGLVTMLWTCGGASGHAFFNVYLDSALRVPTALIGSTMAAGKLLAGITSLLAAPILMSRWGRRRTFTLGAVGTVASLLPLALVAHWIPAGLGFALMITTESVAWPTLTVFSQEAVPRGWRPAMSGAFFLAEGIAFTLMGLAGGFAITALGYRPYFLIAAAFPAVAAPLFWFYFNVPRGEYTPRAAAQRGAPESS